MEMDVSLLCLCMVVASLTKEGHAQMGNQALKRPQDIFTSSLDETKRPSLSSFKKSYMAPYYSSNPYQSSYPSGYPSYYPYSYPSPVSAPYPYSFGGSIPAGYPAVQQSSGQTVQASCVGYAGTPARNRSEKFEIKGKSFKSIGCWSDTSVRAIETLEGKHPLLKDPDYKSRVNALMKCAEAALERSLTMFALQNGGQCFGGKNAEKNFRKYGPSTACCGDGEGGPWSNEVYSFLGDNGKPMVNASYNPWSPWSPCPQTCNNGNNSAVQVRNRTCYTYVSPDLGCGNLGSITVETRPCGVQICPGVNNTGNKSTTLRPNPSRPPTTQQTDLPKGTGPPTAPPTSISPSQQRILQTSPPSTFTPTASPTSISPTQPSVCTAKVDLGFLIDGSGSIERAGPGNFKRELNFVKQIVKGFEVSKEGTHVGVIIFSSGARIVSNFDEHYDKGSALAAIDRIGYPAGGTNIGRALNLAKANLFGKSARPGIPNMLVVLTDGKSRDPVAEPAQKLRDSGVTIFGVGIGSGYDVGELKDMATDPDSQHVYKADFNNLDIVVQSIKDRACTGSGGVTQTPRGDPVLQSPPTICKAKVDLAVLIDGSQSIDYFAVGNFRRCLQFVKNFVSGFNIAKEGTHVGIVVFSKNAEIIFGFEKYFSVQTMLTAIDSIKYPRSGTHTGKALDVVRTKLLDASARQGVPNILLVMTDGASQDDVDEPSKKLRDMGVTIFTLGIGNAFDINQLNAMATDPDRDHVFTTEFSKLQSAVIEKIKERVCKGSGGLLLLKDDFDANFGLTEDKMVNDDKFEGEIVGEGGTKDQDEKKAFETVLEGEFHDQDQSENGKLDSLGMETYDNAAEGKNVGRGGRTGVDIGYQGKGKHLSLNEKINIQIPKGNALQSFVLGGRGANFKPLGGRLRHYGNQGLKSLANIVPKRGTARNVVTADLFGKTETKGTRGKENKKGMTSEGESGFVDGQTSFTKTTETSKGTARSRNEISFSSTGLPLAAEVKGQAESRYLQSYEYLDPVALYPLNAKYQARDVIGGNLPGIIKNVVPGAGPFNKSGNSLSFSGTSDSYIEFPNNGNLDVKNSISLLAWVLPKTAGPIFNYKTDGWGVNFWMARPRKLFARFVDRDQKALPRAVKSTHIKPNKWNYVGAIYDQNSGRASLWIHGKQEDAQYIGNITLATNYPVRMGARIGDKRNFSGRISCMQVYNVALNQQQISDAKVKCKSLDGDLGLSST